MPLRCAWAGHPSRCLCAGETLPMWKPTTGEPYAGEPHVRFGGRGGATPLPDPYRIYLSAGPPDGLLREGDKKDSRSSVSLLSRRPDLHLDRPFGAPVDKLVDKGIAGTINLGGRSVPDDAARIQHRNAVGDLARADEVMGDR